MDSEYKEASMGVPLSSGREGGLEYWGEIMAASFVKMDEEVNNEEREYPEEEESEGSTTVVVMVGEEELVVANCEGSRFVMYHAAWLRLCLVITR
ncbi:hypothetical protein Ddye_002848 [Dipteronia dyeriana]|uniref:PPM-type phosphatase domain-containing protein n=1 Tax=Dipteronia dyeriana TaxID=168575 RepID=A0AAD9XR61_9ROSI|nr:hypothetical protein Ddye_002848 [Dipteronia dyeriana]